MGGRGGESWNNSHYLKYMKTSQGEQILRELLAKKYKGYKLLYNFKPAALLNPKTKRRLELDVYIPAKRIA